MDDDYCCLYYVLLECLMPYRPKGKLLRVGNKYSYSNSLWKCRSKFQWYIWSAYSVFQGIRSTMDRKKNKVHVQDICRFLSIRFWLDILVKNRYYCLLTAVQRKDENSNYNCAPVVQWDICYICAVRNISCLKSFIWFPVIYKWKIHDFLVFSFWSVLG